MKDNHSTLRLNYLGINTYKEPIIYMREDRHICRSEGFDAQARVRVTLNERSIVATLNTIETNVLRHNEASLSDYAWELLSAKNCDQISITHYAETQGELHYALDLLKQGHDIFQIEVSE